MQLPKCMILLETLLLFLISAKSQEVSTISSIPSLGNYKAHPYHNVNFLKNYKAAKPTKQGPVLFPNDGPAAPRPPLIVTSRPITESIARSELNNTITSQSQLHEFLTGIGEDYRLSVTPKSSAYYKGLSSRIPYADVVNKNRYHAQKDNRYNDYEEQTVLPPIYKALGDHARKNVLKINENHINYQPQYNNKHRSNEINHDVSTEHDQNNNYAFSYTVKDQKTGDDFSHSQHSSGSATNGEYRVRLPDGRMQIVSYTADENGYKADVRYDEEKIPENSFEINDYYLQDKHASNNHKKETSRNYIENDKDYNYVPKNIPDDIFYPTLNSASNRNNDFNTQNTDYVDRTINNNKYSEEIKPVHETDYSLYPDISDNYDYSLDYNHNRQNYNSKFAAFAPTTAASAKVTPDYEKLKKLLVTKDAYKTKQNYDWIDLNVTTTPSPYEETTEHVVVITKPPNLYTNIRHSLLNLGPVPHYIPKINPVTSSNSHNINPAVSFDTNIIPTVVSATTPRSYLISTIGSLKNKVHLAKPILSDHYINKINKYLYFN